MSESEFDVIVVGAGPAGAVAAAALARRRRRVLLLERARLPRADSCGGWLTALAEPFLAELSAKTKKVLATPFCDVTFRSADFQKKSIPRFDGPVGFIINRAEFDAALVQSAVDFGATLRDRCEARNVSLNEHGAEVLLENGRSVRGRLLVVATGRGSRWPEAVGLAGGRAEAPLLNAQVESALPPDRGNQRPRVCVVLGLDGGASFGLVGVTKKRLLVNVNWGGDAEAVVRTLIELCGNAHAAGVAPVDLSAQAASAPIIRNPLALALDMDTHVGKHTLVVGDAGGFVSAASNEGIYPAMWSARIAAQVIDHALDCTYVQDELTQFDSAWRIAMADHLRSPHTDLRFLLPLIFSNQPMADRMGAAFFLGKNI